MEALKVSVPELLARIPEVLGFEPRESVAILGIGARGDVAVGLQIDRDECVGDQRVAEGVARLLESERATGVMLVSFTGDDVRLACPAIDALQPALARVCDPVEAWAVVNGRFFSPGCFDPACCPERGRPLRPRRADAFARHRRQAAIDGAGDRWWNERAVAPERWRRASARRWDRAMRSAETGAALPGVTATGRLVASLLDVHVRDYVLVRTIGGEPRARRDALAGGPSDAVAAALDAVLKPRAHGAPGARVARLDSLFAALLAEAMGERRAPLATLRCLIAWWSNDISWAICACGDALEADPTYRLAALLAAALEHDVQPGWRRAAP